MSLTLNKETLHKITETQEIAGGVPYSVWAKPYPPTVCYCPTFDTKFTRLVC
jgi:hypothetical protein